MSAILAGVQFGAATVAVVGGAAAAYRFGARRWRQTIGRRRAQAEILDQLCCTSSVAFVESKLGVPQFIRHDGGYEQRFYRLPGAWITIEPIDDAVRAFTITITDAGMYYETKGLTFGVVDVRLGVDTFANTRCWDAAELAIGARHATYVQHYGANNPSGFQEYWLAHNMTGAGQIGGERYASGFYTDGYNKDYLNPEGTFGSAPDLAAITANSLTLLSPEGGREHAEHLNSLTAHGPHYEHLRLLWTERERCYPQEANAGRRVRPPGMSRWRNRSGRK